MKLSDIEPGTRILIPCPQCEDKKSVVFKNRWQYERAKTQKCARCRGQEATDRKFWEAASVWKNRRFKAI